MYLRIKNEVAKFLAQGFREVEDFNFDSAQKSNQALCVLRKSVRPLSVCWSVCLSVPLLCQNERTQRDAVFIVW